MNNYKVCWITLCKNEIDIIPFCIDYWKRIANKVVVYDNGSTDGSIEELQKHHFIEVRHFDSNGQNDIIQKEVKQNAYQEFKNDFDIVIITDMDEVFYFDDFKAISEAFISGGYNVLMTPIYSLCEDAIPLYDEDKLLHQQCHKFYHQKMNHIQGFDQYSKLSIFNTKVTDKVMMSVGQHYVQTSPEMRIMLSNDGFNLHIDKGLSKSFFIEKRQKMGANLSETNKRANMCIEYLKSVEELEKEYDEKQKNAFDINDL